MSKESSAEWAELDPVVDPQEVAKRDPQRLRLQRMLWACIPLSTLVLCVVVYVGLGWVPVARALEYSALILVLWSLFFTAVLSGLNQRLADPSMTVVQILSGIFCQLYIMFFLPEPLMRVPFLLLGTVNMMFAVFAMNLWRMLLLNVVGVSAYAIMIVLKAIWNPVGLAAWQTEALVILAFFLSIAMNAYIGSVIVGLRDKLQSRNRELKTAMVQLKELATRDPLTRLPNRRFMVEQMQKESARVARSEDPGATLCLCMLDVDHFKDINDRFGHQAGDQVLQWLGDILCSQVREQDFVGRFGGEEFLLLLPNTDQASAQQSMDRLRHAIGAVQPPALPEGYRLTVSVGIADHHAASDLNQTLQRADQAMYQAKDRGRDQVVFAQP